MRSSFPAARLKSAGSIPPRSARSQSARHTGGNGTMAISRDVGDCLAFEGAPAATRDGKRPSKRRWSRSCLRRRCGPDLFGIPEIIPLEHSQNHCESGTICPTGKLGQDRATSNLNGYGRAYYAFLDSERQGPGAQSYADSNCGPRQNGNQRWNHQLGNSLGYWAPCQAVLTRAPASFRWNFGNGDGSHE